ncbi:RNA polymerase sigma factor [Actinoplanes cyaneus]|uniref:RNA polymerase sigma factor n=1 Tax=Actinoplanes cyaneus TaxID=52696 RepID=A0A919ID30_9ACTN|nr:sigma-70 family RNA polymerase sigma factor [Actinoplanes cyaneus]MCW2142607.1 RNA polymerase sigma-70 factor, ECF subfamily [Actinoplanes cyaneus]GID62156.1 RNA polymerase sigma factor [Actinoplanes cyaneus]
MDEELLVVRCQLGERDAFAALVRAWHPAVERYVARMLGGPDDDVTQEVWLAIIRGLPRLRQPDRFAPWLFVIARRAVMNRLRDAYATPEQALDDTAGGDVADGDATGGDAADAVADRELVAGALAALPVREREVLLLFHLEDLSLQACAQICGVPVGTVKSRLNRARRLLRRELARKGYEQ